jgi:hypothetical protein
VFHDGQEKFWLAPIVLVFLVFWMPIVFAGGTAIGPSSTRFLITASVVGGSERRM